ncbi:MAG: SWIM zinc finger family protein [Rhodospirillales bacterium]|nr:SWIM zinc finger family protein [Rhodospirillales bacterium]MCB9994803.1 SWIM zinc finger family protein [Rhodospirillales bacterium]
MQRLEFIVEGSKGDEYEVSFEREGNNLDVFCTCAAGENGLYCKHRFALMDGDVGALLSENENDVAALKELMKGTDVEAAYNDVMSLQAQYDEIHTRLKAAKKILAKAMYR